MIKKLDHVGIVVKDLDKGTKIFSDILHLTPWARGIVDVQESGIATDRESAVRLVLLPIGNNSIELLEPVGTKSLVAQHLKEKGGGVLNLSFFAEEFDMEIKMLKEKGYKVEVQSTTQLFPGFTVRMAFLSPKQTCGVLIEIVDSASLPPNL